MGIFQAEQMVTAFYHCCWYLKYGIYDLEDSINRGATILELSNPPLKAI